MLLPTPPAVASHRTSGWTGQALHLGSKGEQVRAWQRALNITADGDFGPQTFAATKAWQQQRGLMDFGWVGPTSWGEMFGEVPGTGEVTVEGSGWGHGIGMSQYGALVLAREGQTAEEILDYYYGGAEVKSMSAALGKDHWLVTDRRPLWISLISGNKRAVLQAGNSITSCWPMPGTLSAGDTGPSVERLQSTLDDLGYNPGPVNGKFSAQTTSAVLEYQADESLAVDGIVGRQTANSLWPNRVGECFLEARPVDGELVITVDENQGCRVETWSEPLSCWGTVFGINKKSIVGVEVGSRVKQIASDVLRVRPARSGLHIIWETAVDPYVAGLAEVPSSWPRESLRAQGIAARSYAVASAKRIGPESRFSSSRRAACWCHLYGDTRSQFYLGHQKAITAGWGPAVRSTDSLVLDHPDDGLVQAFYSAASGGRTENMEEVWSQSRRDYLVTTDDIYVLDPRVNPNAVWVSTFSPNQIADRFDLGKLESIRVAARNSSGSVRTIEMEGSKTNKRVSGGTFQSVMRLKSRYYNVMWPVPKATDNRAPQGRAGLGSISISLGEPAGVLDVSSSFFDANGDVLTFSAVADHPEVVRGEVEGTKIYFHPVGSGNTTVEIIAADPDGGTATQTVKVSVTAPSIDLGSVELVRGDPPQLVDVSSVTVDAAGEVRSATVEVAEPEVVTVSLEGSSMTVTPVAAGQTSVRLTAVTSTRTEVVGRLTVSVSAPLIDLGSVELAMGDPPQLVDVSSVAVDATGEVRSATVEVAEPEVVTASLEGSSMTVTPVEAGQTSVRVTAVTATGIQVVGNLSVSVLAPVLGTFADDDGNTHEANIELAVLAGITRGCDPPDNRNFCPERTVTRAELASFLVRAFDLGSDEIDWFEDDEGNTHEAQINRLAWAGVTLGCDPPHYRNFCPDRPVSRAELATLLSRVLLLAPAEGNRFSDDDGNTHEAYINALAAAGFTQGCDPPDNLRYCPERGLTRAEMASFLVRTLAL